MKLKSPHQTPGPAHSPAGDILRGARTSGGPRRSPLLPNHRSPNIITKPAPWRGGSRLRTLMGSAASTALQGLKAPRDDVSQSFGGLLPQPTQQRAALPEALANDPALQALLGAWQAKGAQGQTHAPTTPVHSVYTDESGLETFRFTLSADQAVERIGLHRLRDTDREHALEAPRVRRILEAVMAGKALPPIQVSKQYSIQNGYHRYFVSKLLGFAEIDVVVPRG